jgi:hypothetical protein
MNASYITYNTEKEMNDSADIILYGSPIDKFEDRKHVNTYINNGKLSDFYTITKFKVKKVLKNSSSLSINNSDLFDIIEPISIVQEFDGKKILTMESYEAMVENNRYIVYIKSNNMGGYSVINMSNGKFNQSQNEKENDQKHLNLKKEVLNKYSNDLGKIVD